MYVLVLYVFIMCDGVDVNTPHVKSLAVLLISVYKDLFDRAPSDSEYLWRLIL